MFKQISYPIIQAPMAGGVSMVDLALAVSKNGGLGFLAAGYKTPEVLEEEIATCTAAAYPFGVNLFVPQNDIMDDMLEQYQQRLEVARGLKNDFISTYEHVAPAIYPAVHTLTQPIRAAALNNENPQAMSLWASIRFKEIMQGSVKDVFEQLISELSVYQSL